MKKKIIAIGIVIAMLFAIVSLGGCGDRHYGINAGFNRRQVGLQDSFWIAVRSEGFEFDVDNVELEFFFGWSPSGWSEFTDYRDIFVLYFFDSSDLHSKILNDLFCYYGHKDVKSVSEYLHYIETICGDVFRSEQFATNSPRRGVRQFNHSQIIVIDQDILLLSQGGIGFMVALFSLDEEGILRGEFAPHIIVWFQLVNHNTVRLVSEVQFFLG
ncbi:MAG: hypothetical protein FWC02_03650 [Firmicutes bacterium]|nr:hypothetical protein [Bacillota bacterium]